MQLKFTDSKSGFVFDAGACSPEWEVCADTVTVFDEDLPTNGIRMLERRFSVYGNAGVEFCRTPALHLSDPQLLRQIAAWLVVTADELDRREAESSEAESSKPSTTSKR